MNVGGKRNLCNCVGQEADATTEFQRVIGDNNLNGSARLMTWVNNSYWVNCLKRFVIMLYCYNYYHICNANTKSLLPTKY